MRLGDPVETPLGNAFPLALRLLDRIPVNDLKAIAKGGPRDQIVQAARKRLGEAR